MLASSHIYFFSVTLTTWVDTSKSSEPAKVATLDFCSNGFINEWLKDGLSIDKLEEQLNVLKANFTEKQTLIEEMMAKCKVSDTKRSIP